MTISQDIVNSIFADDSKINVVDQIMDGIASKVSDLIDNKKTEVFAKEMISITDQEEEEE